MRQSIGLLAIVAMVAGCTSSAETLLVEGTESAPGRPPFIDDSFVQVHTGEPVEFDGAVLTEALQSAAISLGGFDDGDAANAEARAVVVDHTYVGFDFGATVGVGTGDHVVCAVAIEQETEGRTVTSWCMPDEGRLSRLSLTTDDLFGVANDPEVAYILNLDRETFVVAVDGIGLLEWAPDEAIVLFDIEGQELERG